MHMHEGFSDIERLIYDVFFFLRSERPSDRNDRRPTILYVLYNIHIYVHASYIIHYNNILLLLLYWSVIYCGRPYSTCPFIKSLSPRHLDSISVISLRIQVGTRCITRARPVSRCRIRFRLISSVVFTTCGGDVTSHSRV